MGSGIMPYAVPLDQVRGAVGSGDEKLFRRLVDEFAARIDSSDKDFSDEIEDGCPGLAEALGHIILGAPPLECCAFQYAYAFELIVKHFGQMLDNGAFYPAGCEYLDLVDEALGALGIRALRVAQWIGFDLPVDLPRPDEFPGAGYLEAPALASGAEQFRKVAQAQIDAIQDRCVRDAVVQIRHWCEVCAQRGHGLVAFYY